MQEKKRSVYIHVIPKEITGYDYDKYYVGITSVSPKKRWRNGRGYKENQIFSRAISKYGWSNIKHIVLYENLSQEKACNLEVELIKKYKSNDRIHGYNICSGGEGSVGRKPTAETKHKIAESNKLYYKNNPDRIANNPILQFDLNGNYIAEYKNIAYASRSLNIPRRSISNVDNGQMRRTHGYVFLFKDKSLDFDDIRTEILSTDDSIKQKCITNNHTNVVILRISENDGSVFEYQSYRQAERDGFSRYSIKKVINSNLIYCCSFWKTKGVI